MPKLRTFYTLVSHQNKKSIRKSRPGPIPYIPSIISRRIETYWESQQKMVPHCIIPIWNLKITYMKRKITFQTSIIMFHVNLRGCIPSIFDVKTNHFRRQLCFNPRYFPTMGCRAIFCRGTCWKTQLQAETWRS